MEENGSRTVNPDGTGGEMNTAPKWVEIMNHIVTALLALLAGWQTIKTGM